MEVGRVIPWLTALIRAGVGGPISIPAPLPESEDPFWLDLLEVARRHEVAPLLHAGVKRGGIALPERVQRELQLAARASEARSGPALDQLHALVCAFDAAGMEPLVLKGALFCHTCYRSPGLRPFSDLDLLVLPEAREQAAQVLLGLGYSFHGEDGGDWWSEHHHHWVFVKERSLPVELHWGITPPCSRVQVDVLELWQRSTAWSCPGGRARALSPEEEVLHLALHAAKHQFRAPLRQFADLAAYRSQHPDLDWRRIWGAACHAGAQTDLAVYLAVAGQLEISPKPAELEAPLRRVLAGIPVEELAVYAVAWPFFDHPHGLIGLLGTRNSFTAASGGRSLFRRAQGGPATRPGKSNEVVPATGRLRRFLSKANSLRGERANLRAAVAVRRLFQDREAP